MTDNEFLTWLDSKHANATSWQRTKSGFEVVCRGKLILINDEILKNFDSWSNKCKNQLLNAILHKEAKHGKKSRH